MKEALEKKLASDSVKRGISCDTDTNFNRTTKMTPRHVQVSTPPPESRDHEVCVSPDSISLASDASWSPDAVWPDDLHPRIGYHDLEELHLPPTRETPISDEPELPRSSSWICPDGSFFSHDEDATFVVPFACRDSSRPASVPLTDASSTDEEDSLAELRTAKDANESYGMEIMAFSDMSEAYSKGFQYFLSLMSSQKTNAPSEPKEEVCPLTARWNGHLPLAPMPKPPPEATVGWQRGRRRRQREDIGRLSPVSSFNTPTSPPSSPLANATFPTTLSGHDIEILLHMNDDKKEAEKLRKAPNPQASLSIPAAQAAALKLKEEQKGKQQQHQQHVKREAEAAVASDLDSALQAATPSGVEQVHMEPRGSPPSALKELPPLRDAPPAKKEELFIQKLQLCGVIFSFDDPTSDKRGKDMKRQTLLELVDYVNTPAGQKIFTESVMGDLMAMVSANVCRALPPATDDFDPEEDEPVLEPAWPHLQVAYEFFLRFIVSSEVNAKAAKKYVDQKFCLQLVELFDSEDPRERDYLKTILHRIYGKFMSHRSFIRRAISNVFYRFVYETERHNGIGELLEILGSIINGFAIPLKKEHLQFLVRALIPLHKPKCVALYHQQLSYCIIQYVEKDADTATPILEGFFKCWPWSCSGKQVMFLNELEEILELLGADQLAQISNTLFTNLARCLDSDHFQVVERALFLWNNEHLVNSGCLSRLNAQTVLPIIYGPLYKNSSGHWNATVEGLAQNVLKMYMEYDLVLYDKCTAAYFREEEEAKRKLDTISDRWAAIENEAMSKMPALTAGN